MRKSAFYGKAHSVLIDSRKDALCDPQIAQTAPFRHAAAPGRCGTTARQAAGHYGEWLNWANALEQPPASLRGGLCQGPQISVQSLDSRKSALCTRQLTERRIPAAGPHGTERRARTIRAPTDSYGLMEAISSPTCTFPDSSSSTFSSSLELVTMSMT